MSTHVLWQSVLGELELTIAHSAFATWFKNTELVKATDEEVVIAAINSFAIRQFQVRYDAQIREALKNNGVTATAISYIVRKNQESKRTVISRETTQQPSTPAPASGLPLQAASLTAPRAQGGSLGTLNPRYTFDNFIVGSSNDLAYTACQAVAANPGVKYNPLFLYGGVGLGKTHLMQAVGNAICHHNPKARVMYVTTEAFVNDFLEHIRFKKQGFSHKYRNVDVLIVDDMQCIAGKEKTQEEFFHSFNELHQNNKQIIISSDKQPRNIPTLTERLRSRFEWGMAIDIQMPDFETRCAIVEAKAALSGVELARPTGE